MAQDIERYIQFKISKISYPLFFKQKLERKFGAPRDFFDLVND